MKANMIMKNADMHVTAPVVSIESLIVRTRLANGKLGRTIVDDLSLTVDAGETVCIVGESGSGKSVTSLTAMGLLPEDTLKASAGRILIDGEDILHATPERMRQLRASKISMVFQEPMTALNPVQRVGHQVEEVLRLHTKLNRHERRTKVLAMLESVHLPDVSLIHQSFPHQLSGGQRQRIVIAMALILQPRVLIADEPTTALDVTTQKQILSLIRELQEKHHTAVIFITHDFGVVAEISHRIVVMHQGKVVETGTRDEILAHPREAYTRMLVSCVPSLVPNQRAIPEGDCVLELNNLSKIYSRHTWFKRHQPTAAASNISLKVRRGEVVGIVGESGSGKSTVARCAARLIDATSGSIHLDGVDIGTASGKPLRQLRKRIQIIFQDPYRSLNPRIRIGDSLTEGLLNYGYSSKDARAKAIRTLELVALPADAIDRFPHQFSGGQRQRICIARALVMEPDVLIADEAVSALDVSVQEQVLALLDEVRQRVNVGVLFITHDLRVAAQICDSIVVMRQGCIIETGDATSVLTQPQHIYTRSLIEAAPGRHWDFQHFRPIATSQPIVAA